MILGDSAQDWEGVLVTELSAMMYRWMISVCSVVETGGRD